MKLEITKEKVLEAASKCETAKQTLKTLFPEVFEDYNSIIVTHRSFSNDCTNPHRLIGVRADGLYMDKSFWCNQNYNWELKKDEYGMLCLIPTKK